MTHPAIRNAVAIDPMAQMRRDLARISAAVDPMAQLRRDLARISAMTDPMAQVRRDLARLGSLADPMVQLRRELAKISAAIDPLAQLRHDLARFSGSLAEAFADSGPRSSVEVWSEHVEGRPGEATASVVESLRRREPSLSPELARALVLGSAGTLIFLGLFLLALAYPEQARELSALSGATPWGVASTAVTVAAAYWVVTSQRDG